MKLKLIPALVAGVLCAAPAYSAVIDFEGASSFASVAGYYGGGTDGNGASGTDYGVLFGGGALAVANDELGPYFSNAPSPGTVMTVVDPDATMNVAVGFSNQASFFYSSSADATIRLYSGLDGSGSLLGTFTLLGNAQNGCSDTTFCNWAQALLNFNGVAKSIMFGDAAGVAMFDNIQVAPVPLPAAAWLLLSALGGLGLLRRKSVA
jgi:hypothetical protein